MQTMIEKTIHNFDTDGTWHQVGTVESFPPGAGIAVKIQDRQIAVYRFAVERGAGVGSVAGESEAQWYACDNTCPHKQDNVLARGLIGDHGGEPMVACPMHKKAFSLRTGACLNDADGQYRVRVYPVKVESGQVYLQT